MEQYQGQLSALRKEQVVLKENSAKVAEAMARSEDQCEEMKQAMDKVLADQKNDKEHHRQELKELKQAQQEMNKAQLQQMTSSIQIQRDAENSNNEKIRQEHKAQLQKLTQEYEHQRMTLENTYKEEMLENQQHFLREKNSALQRYDNNVARLKKRSVEDKHRALDDCVELNKTELELACQTLHKEHVAQTNQREVEWGVKWEELRVRMEHEKEQAVSSCLTSTLEEMSIALEMEQKKRREQVRNTREEWRTQMKTAVDTTNRNHQDNQAEYKMHMKQEMHRQVEAAKRSAVEQATTRLKMNYSKQIHNIGKY